MKGARPARRESGFTLVELLVVILVIAILAAIAIPVFLAQRNKARVATAQRSLKDAALAAEAYGADNGGDYSGLDDDGLTKLENHGFNPTTQVDIGVQGDTSSYCILARSHLLEPSHDWYWSSYLPENGAPTSEAADENFCTGEDPDLPLDFPDLPDCLPPVLVPPLCD